MKNIPHFAEYMMDEMAFIEDRWITEAESEYVPTKRKRAFRTRYAIILTAALLVLSFPIVSLSISLRGAKSEDHAPEDEGILLDSDINQSLDKEDGMDHSVVGGTESLLSNRLVQIRTKTADLRIPKDQLSLSDGIPRIVWQYEDEADYRVLAIDSSDCRELIDLAKDSTPLNDTALPTVRLWIVTESGTVLSPYSGQTRAELFDYEPTQIPCRSFAEALLALLP